MKQVPEGETLAVVEALVALSAADLPYSDLYLHRAEVLLGRAWPREQYVALRRERDGLPGLAKELRHLAESGDWQQVRVLAQQGVRRVQHIGANERLLLLGDTVYGPRVVNASAMAVALNGTMVEPTSHAGHIREDCVARLRFALLHDKEYADLYRIRLAHLDGLEIVADAATGTPLNPDGLQLHIIEAADRGDFEQADRLSAAIIDAASRNEAGCLRAQQTSNGQMCTRPNRFSDVTVCRAGDLGLSVVTLNVDEALDGYLGRPLASGMPGSDHLRPPAVSSGLREVLDLLMRHPFVTSAGSRYLPSFSAETMLVETFPETKPETHTGLLDSIALRGRRGVSRLAIEDAVRSYNTSLCADLGLDPLRYAAIPIPFDAYVRLAPRFDWGRQHLWTHFDGYQLTRELHLRALVGGDVRYGGPEDLCCIARDYETEHLLARFAVVGRDRLTAHAPQVD